MTRPRVKAKRAVSLRLRSALHGFRARARAQLLTPLLGLRPSGHLILLHLGRSGSTVLGDLMNQHPDVHWDGEIYHRVLHTASTPSVDAIAHLQHRIPRAGRRLWCGEVKLTHLRRLGLPPAKFLEHTRQLGASVIILERRNCLRRLVSSLIVEQTQHFHLIKSQQLDLKPFQIDVDHVLHQGKSMPLLEHLHALEADYRSLKQATASLPRLLYLSYEDDIESDPTVAYEKICHFMGLAHCNVEVRLAKVNRYELSQLIANYDQLKEHLAGTPYVWMLDP